MQQLHCILQGNLNCCLKYIAQFLDYNINNIICGGFLNIQLFLITFFCCSYFCLFNFSRQLLKHVLTIKIKVSNISWATWLWFSCCRHFGNYFQWTLELIQLIPIAGEEKNHKSSRYSIQKSIDANHLISMNEWIKKCCTLFCRKKCYLFAII